MTPAGAKFSRCRRWRYLLWRCWDEAKPVANFLMLNPSTADEFKLDPSCTRARNYAERWGFGALVVTNIFGWRSTDPAALKTVDDPIGRGNDAAIVKAAKGAKLVVCAWGNHGLHAERAEGVKALQAATDCAARSANERRRTAGPSAIPAVVAQTNAVALIPNGIRGQGPNSRITQFAP